MPAIEFRGVRFERPGGRVVLDRFDLAVEQGETLALVGRSGAGKSTVLKLVNRLLEPDAGTVLVEGRETAAWDPIALRRHAGYVLQEVGLFPHLTVEGNVGLVPRLAGWSASDVRARVGSLLDLVDLPASEYAGRWPDELSGGQRQRVGVARALALDPPVLLMDEPFGAIDPITRAELHRGFRRIQEQLRKAVVLVTHDLAEAVRLADRIGVLEGGRLVACGPWPLIARSEDSRIRRLVDSLPTVPRV